jgi:hypothetical protein
VTTIPSATNGAIDQSVQRYRRMLWLYPADFRDEYGDDLVQAYRDLILFSADGRGVWWRTTRDLLTSATRERASALSPKSPKTWIGLAGIVALVLVSVLVGGTGGVLFIPAAVLVGLPVFGISRFWHAWTIRRTTGGAVLKDILFGLACLLPAAALLAFFGEDAGYWVFIAVAGTAILGAAAGIVWAAISLIRKPQPGTRRPWLLAALFAVPSVAVLAFIIGASVNSYLRTIGPSGDHSVENAAPESRALWTAAGSGNLHQVTRITSSTCADPWVRYTADQHGNRENARGHAIVNSHPDIEQLLDDYMDKWFGRCGQPG